MPATARHERDHADCGYDMSVTGRNTLQATVYVDTRDVQRVAVRLAARLGGTVAHMKTIVAPTLDLYVVGNDDKTIGLSDEDAFLTFPCLVEAFTTDIPPDEAVVSAVANVLAALDELGLRYVTAADFEHELPRGGQSGS